MQCRRSFVLRELRKLTALTMSRREVELIGRSTTSKDHRMVSADERTHQIPIIPSVNVFSRSLLVD